MEKFNQRCLQTRQDIITMLEKGQRGHILSSLSIVEILVTLYYYYLNISSKNANDPKRDRFILSKGHGAMALYSVLARLDFFDTSYFNSFCLPGGILGGHPERNKIPGIEATTGSLGHGLSIATGMAIHCKNQNYNNQIVTLLGDGECQEGSIWEAMLSISNNQLNNLTIIIDYNKQQSYGPTAWEPFGSKWQSFGASVFEIDMINNPLELLPTLQKKTDTAKVIICHTVKGQGIPFLENNLSWHHKLRPTSQEIDRLKKELYETNCS